MGGSYREVADRRRHGAGAVPSRGRRPHVPDPDYVRDPGRRQRAAARVLPAPGAPARAAASTRTSAIAQTPYSAFPGSATRLERIAGATTDLQHIVHQGLTYYDATFWVGANAVIRKRALDDIVEIVLRGRLGDPALHPGPHGHRGHRVHHRHGHPRLAAVQLPRAAQLQRHPAGLRLAVHPAPPLGQRRPADPAQAAPAVPGRGAPRASGPGSASCSCAGTTWPRSSGARSAC